MQKMPSFFEFVLQVLIQSSLHYQSGRHTRYRHPSSYQHTKTIKHKSILLVCWARSREGFFILLYKIISCRGVFFTSVCSLTLDRESIILSPLYRVRDGILVSLGNKD
jgi:hypothetical protein